MKKDSVLYFVILFVLMPVAYYFTYMSIIFVVKGGKFFNYLILIVCVKVIITTNIFLLRKINR